jgi:hypothetical protein
MKKQRGQAIVEFALVLPLFMMLLFGAILSGLMFADYMTLSNVARSSAREASLQGESKYGEIREKYRSDTRLLTDMYTWPSGQEGMEFRKNDAESMLSNSVTVIITTDLNTSFPGVSFFKTIMDFPPDHFVINYTMHDETASTASE